MGYNDFFDSISLIGKSPTFYINSSIVKPSRFLNFVNMIMYAIITSIICYLLYSFFRLRNKVNVVKVTSLIDKSSYKPFILRLMVGLTDIDGQYVKLIPDDFNIEINQSKFISCDNPNFILTKEMSDLIYYAVCYEYNSFSVNSNVSFNISIKDQIDSEFLRKYSGAKIFVRTEKYLDNESDFNKSTKSMHQLFEFEIDELMNQNQQTHKFDFWFFPRKILDDQGYLFSLYDITENLYYNRYMYFCYSTSRENLARGKLWLNFNLDNIEEQITLTYQSIPDLLAQIVGIYFFFAAFFWVSTVWYREVQYYYDLIKENFRVETLQNVMEDWEIKEILSNLVANHGLVIKEFTVDLKENDSHCSSNSASEIDNSSKLSIVKEISEQGYETTNLQFMNRFDHINYRNHKNEELIIIDEVEPNVSKLSQKPSESKIIAPSSDNQNAYILGISQENQLISENRRTVQDFQKDILGEKLDNSKYASDLDTNRALTSVKLHNRGESDNQTIGNCINTIDTVMNTEENILISKTKNREP